MATGTIDELVIQIKADTKQLQTELKKIEGKIKVTGAAGGAALGMGAGGLGARLKGIKGPALVAAASIVAIGLAITAISTFWPYSPIIFAELFVTNMLGLIFLFGFQNLLHAKSFNDIRR